MSSPIQDHSETGCQRQPKTGGGMANRRLRLVPVAVAVIERRGRYLISRRRASDHLGGFWEFPGGKRHVWEPWEACLKRELREELGIAVEPTGRLSPIRFRYADRQVYLEVFRCRITAGVPTPLGCQEVRWVRTAHLRRYRFPPADRELIAMLSTQQLGCGVLARGTRRPEGCCRAQAEYT